MKTEEIIENKETAKKEIAGVNFDIYIKKMLEEVHKSFRRFGLNENLDLIMETYIHLGIANSNLELYPENEPLIANLKKELELFIYDVEQTANERTFVLLGAAGSGKSANLQIEYIQALKNWKNGDPLPIFIDLSVECNLKRQWEWLCTEIGLNEFGSLDAFQTGYPVILFIDSYNEAAEKINHISNFYMALGNNNKNKAIICCRSDFLKVNESFLKYFASKEDVFDVILRFIVPMIRNSEFKITEEFAKNYYQVWETNKEINEQIDIQEITTIMREYI